MELKYGRGISTALTIGVILVIVIAGVGAAYLSTTGQKTTITNTVVSTSTVATTATVSLTTTSTSVTNSSKYKLALVLGGDETDDGFNAAAIQAAEAIQSVFG